MKNYYFYTDPNTLNAQDPNQAFGPAGDGVFGASGDAGKDKCRMTNLITIESYLYTNKLNAKAMCNGYIDFQEDENGIFVKNLYALILHNINFLSNPIFEAL